LNSVKTAIVHDWFASYAGSEKVVESLTNVWQKADIYVLFNLLNENDLKTVSKRKDINTSFLQRFRSIKKNYRKLLPLFPYAIEQFDLSGYDLVISSSHAVAKGVLTNSNQLHISYIHTPIRYAWDLTHQYLKEANLEKGIRSFIAKLIFHYIRIWDSSASLRADHLIANSNYIAKRIKKIYKRDAEVIYPPVDTKKFRCEANKDNYYVTVSRFVPYKKVDLIAEAFTKMPDKKLLIIGEGPDEDKIKMKAGSNIEFGGYKKDEELEKVIQKAKAFVFAAEEDFGIVVVEALSCGTPVIALNKGGASETVINGDTGILFDEQSVESLITGINNFEKNINKFNPDAISKYAAKFDRAVFEMKIRKYVEKKWSEFINQ
jgi:glycosyltransferase involved in cell wall biosynthesis